MNPEYWELETHSYKKVDYDNVCRFAKFYIRLITVGIDIVFPTQLNLLKCEVGTLYIDSKSSLMF